MTLNNTAKITTVTTEKNINLPKYLLKHFDQIAKDEGFKTDYKIEHDVGTQNGDGFIAEMLRVTIIGRRILPTSLKPQSTNEINDRLSLICKLIPTNEARREQFSSDMLFEREVIYYTKVLPALVAFQREKGIINMDEQFCEYAKCYVAERSIDSDHPSFIIMSDLRVKGYAMWNSKAEPMPFNNVKLIMIALGKLHGLSIAFRDQKPTIFQQFKHLNRDLMLSMCDKEAMRNMLTTNLDELANEVALIETNNERRDSRMLRRLRDNWLDLWKECLTEDLAEPFTVLGHGDCWNNNFLFRNNKNNLPEEVILIDWQMGRLSSPVLDLTYFFLSTTDKKLRDQHFDEFIQIYYQQMCKTIRLCGSDPEHLFPFNELQKQFQRFSKYAISFAPLLISIIISNSDNIVDMDSLSNELEKEKGTTTAAASDAAVVVKFDDKSRSVFCSRINGLFDDALRLGWINDE